MSFDITNDNTGTEKHSCLPDYEKRAAELLKESNRYNDFINALEDFIINVDSYRFNSITSLAELYGGLILIQAQINKRYTNTLSKIENKKEA